MIGWRAALAGRAQMDVFTPGTLRKRRREGSPLNSMQATGCRWSPEEAVELQVRTRLSVQQDPRK